MSGGQKDPIIERHCTKENPWDRLPFDKSRIKLIHDDFEEVYPDCDFILVSCKCLNCGHIFTMDMRD